MKSAKKTSHATMLISKKIPKLPRVRGEGWAGGGGGKCQLITSKGEKGGGGPKLRLFVGFINE